MQHGGHVQGLGVAREPSHAAEEPGEDVRAVAVTCEEGRRTALHLPKRLLGGGRVRARNLVEQRERSAFEETVAVEPETWALDDHRAHALERQGKPFAG